MLITALAVAALLVLAPVLATAWIVDDWSRDLSTNTASTASDAEDPSLRPLKVQTTTEEFDEAIRSFADQNGSWELVDSEGGTHKLVRTTGLLRFKDDVTVSLNQTEEGQLVEASSRSRVGKGDLGQNPRNLRELLSGLEQRLAAADD